MIQEGPSIKAQQMDLYSKTKIAKPNRLSTRGVLSCTLGVNDLIRRRDADQLRSPYALVCPTYVVAMQNFVKLLIHLVQTSQVRSILKKLS